ncbi:PTS glucose transporter subunit IIA [Aquibacillus koreensis]|uniref:PTS glucose transporter subunit IIA n=1 Tax=Aquibacillus koreensis TaxID=279446 RepID=A0A9X4ALP8_9BACI|nr:PTS glucose transporter subunit IIA [Aquibacillus koreensis]MCT2537897.1 PTS glucose transporter subunit IIA [Aquibacillus koreensis]MDC3422665.1 PTS glucose transporter subunit IIA [Aquibacillus koreensis]
MIKSLFKKKDKIIEITSPLTGELVELEDVPDQVFSQKMMGDGFAIKPTDRKVVSPIDGEVFDIFQTKHAISLKSKEGLEVLIHMGLETVALNGEGFDIKVSKGQKITKGTELADFDLDKMKELDVKTITPVIFTNSDDFEVQEKQTGQVSVGQENVVTVASK